MKKILYLLLLSLFLFSCSNEKIETDVVKKDFFIEIKKIDEFWKDLVFNKTWKVSSSQDIKLTSQVAWRVSKIFVKEWDQVLSWTIIARMEDNIANYGLALERAQNGLDKASINYESTENKLNKWISDLNINLGNLKIDEYNSKSSLELEKIDNSIKKMTIDYENLKIANIQTIEWFKNSLDKDLITFITFTDNIIDFSDKILWITTENKDKNNKFESYLWAKDSRQKAETEEILRDLINYRKIEINKINYDFEWNYWFSENLLIIETWYSIISDLLTNLDDTLDNSIPSIWSLSESTISWYKMSISNYWLSFNWNNAWFVWIKNSINTFLETYKNTEISLLKQIELLSADKDIYIKWLDTRLEIDESTLDEAISNKQLTLRQLDSVMKDARIWYKQALNNYNKLTIKAPISWIIWTIFTDVWQEVWPGTPLFNISNNLSSEITISFSKDELAYINVWSLIKVNYEWKSYTGSINSISNIADSNLKYISRVSLNSNINFLWNIVNVIVPFTVEKKLIPINIIKINNSWKWVVSILKEWKIVKKIFNIWKIYWDKVEILDEIDPSLLFIITNVSNFDKNKFILKLK